MSALDLLKQWIGASPGAPNFAQPFRGCTMTRTFVDLAQPDLLGGVELLLNGAADAAIRLPFNGLIRCIPDFLTLDKKQKEAIEAFWPDLRDINGQRFLPGVLDPDAVLVEVWPSAFRRLELMFAATEMPVPNASKTTPQVPVPRWFVISGISNGELQNRVAGIVAQTFPGKSIDVAGFFQAKFPIYAPANTTIDAAFATKAKVWAFDSAGLVVDPLVISALLAEIADDIFEPFAAPGADTTTGAERHVLVFSDHRGFPYQPWQEPSTVQPLPNVPPPEFNIGSVADSMSASHVRIFQNPEPNWTSLKNQLVALTVAGDDVRVGLAPHGVAGASLQTSLGSWSFRRVHTTDLGKWFPMNVNPKNDIARFSEGNHVQAMVDGGETFREIYRAYRRTHRNDVYETPDALPDGAPRAQAEIAGAQIYLTNYKISPDHQLVGERALTSTARTQPGSKSVANPLEGATLVPQASVAAVPDQRAWWIVGKKGALPPGAAIELEPHFVSTSFFADDPRLPGEDVGADLFGITVPGEQRTIRAFANSDGQFFLPITFLPDWNREAELRVITWLPDKDDKTPFVVTTSGKGTKRIHAFGNVVLAAPPSFSVPAAGPTWGTPDMILSNNGAGQGALLTVNSTTLALGATLLVANQRNGDITVTLPLVAGTGVTIALPTFALGDIALVAVAPPGNDPSLAAGFFGIGITKETRASGFIPAHPHELIGVLRGAIDAGVDVRLLAYRDQFDGPESADALTVNPGTVAAINATINGKRGEAILDPIVRETGSHHQKATFIRSADGVTAFVGGLDQTSNRWNLGHDEVDPDRPTDKLWHDIHCAIRGKAAWDVYRNFRQRWNVARTNETVQATGTYSAVDPMPAGADTNPAITRNDGTHAVQINRTLPSKLFDYVSICDPEKGERGILRSYERAIDNARDFIYIEEQYFFNAKLALRVNQRLRAPDGPRHVVVVLPRALSEAKALDVVLYAIRVRALNSLVYGKPLLAPGEDGTQLESYVGDRVCIVHPINDAKTPVYVHAKTLIVDDYWMSIGSSNFNRRSMTYDAEIDAATIDARWRRGAGVTPHELRVRLMAEHLGLDALEQPLVEDFRRAFALFRAAVTEPPPWLAGRQRIIAYDPVFTHLGVQPQEYNGVMLDALDAAVDPDGDEIDFASNMIQVLTLLDLLGAAEADAEAATFGGIGAIRVSFDLSALTEVTHHVRTEVTKVEDPEAGKIAAGPLSPSVPATIGLFRIGKTHEITAKAFDAADAVIGTATATVVPAQFSNEVTLVFSV